MKRVTSNDFRDEIDAHLALETVTITVAVLVEVGAMIRSSRSADRRC